MPDQYVERTSLLVDAVPFENKEKLSQYIEANIRKAVDLEELNSFVKKELKKELTETEAQELLKWYSSESGKRVMSFLSEYRSLRKTNEKLEDLAEDWVETDLGKTLKNNFEVVVYPAEILEWSQALDYITRVWITKFIQPEAKLERREFARNISESYKEMTADDIEAMILAPWYILLSEMEPQDVDEYIKFSNTKAAIKFNQAIYRGVLNFFAAPYREQLLKIQADELKEDSP